jgi:hypothetical protein
LKIIENYRTNYSSSENYGGNHTVASISPPPEISLDEGVTSSKGPIVKIRPLGN